MQTIGLFPRLLAKTQIDFTKDDLSFVLKQDYKRTALDNGSLTTNEKLLDLPKLKDLHGKITKSLEECVYKVLMFENNVRPIITSSWCVINKPKDWSPPHKHYNNNLSAILYLNKPEKSGEILFHREDVGVTDRFSTQMVYNFKEQNHFNSHIGSTATTTGDMIIFPSSLNHSVQQNESNEDRIEIALNVFLEGIFDEKLASVNLKVIKE